MMGSTRFLRDILRQPAEMLRTIEHLTGPASGKLEKASALVRTAGHVFLTGIGASWNAGLCAGALFDLGGRSVFMREAGELLHMTALPQGSVIIALSRTGRSIEIVQLIAKAARHQIPLIGITNSADSPLARDSQVAIVIPTALDHAISVNAYSSVLLTASALAASVGGGFRPVADQLCRTIEQCENAIKFWRNDLESSNWLAPAVPYYFLARGGSLGTCHEARLLWEEGVKMPATAMATSTFRHGPQEVVRSGLRVCMWIAQAQMRHQDLAVASDLRELGARVMLIGENLGKDAADLVCQLPSSPPNWQFVVDVLPVQLAAERLARISGVDCDSFRLCSYVVEDEYGLLRRKPEGSSNAG
jgi:glucosamine--fructose-6-phosphate aminotransferase (isomerizing)